MNSLTLNNLLDDGLVINNIWMNKNSPFKKNLSMTTMKKVKNKNSNQFCLLPDNIKFHQVFAIYIKEIYGDGFYFCPIDVNNEKHYYFLIISDGEIANSTDCIISDEVLDLFFSQKPSSKFAKLKSFEIDKSCLSTIKREYLLSENEYKKRRKRLVIITASLFLSFSLIVLFAIDYLLN